MHVTLPKPRGRSRVQTWNRYAYVANNALSFIDPLGLDDSTTTCDPSGHCTNITNVDVTDTMPSGGGDWVLLPGCAQFSGSPGVGCEGGGWRNIDTNLADRAKNFVYKPSRIAQSGSQTSVATNQKPVDVAPGIDIWHNSAQCPNCASYWQNANQITDLRTVGTWYAGAALLGGAPAIAADYSLGESGSALFGRAYAGNPGLWNSNAWFRIGFGWSGTQAAGNLWFRISGNLVPTSLFPSGHIDLWKVH